MSWEQSLTHTLFCAGLGLDEHVGPFQPGYSMSSPPLTIPENTGHSAEPTNPVPWASPSHPIELPQPSPAPTLASVTLNSLRMYWGMLYSAMGSTTKYWYRAERSAGQY